MIQVKAVQSQAEAHRQGLAMSAPSRRRPRQSLMRRAPGTPSTSPTAPGHPVAGGRDVRRPVAPRLGSWLIGLGTRLGGASVRTS